MESSSQQSPESWFKQFSELVEQKTALAVKESNVVSSKLSRLELDSSEALEVSE